MKFGTTVRNPTRHAGETGYSQCSGCGLWYTRLGIGRHWDKCPSPEMQEKRKKIREILQQSTAERLVG